MCFGAFLRVVSDEVRFFAGMKPSVLFLRENNDVLVRKRFAPLVRVLDDAVVVPHHLGKTQHLPRKRAVRILQRRDGVEEPDHMQRRCAHGFRLFRLSAVGASVMPRNMERHSGLWHTLAVKMTGLITVSRKIVQTSSGTSPFPPGGITSRFSRREKP